MPTGGGKEIKFPALCILASLARVSVLSLVVLLSVFSDSLKKPAFALDKWNKDSIVNTLMWKLAGRHSSLLPSLPAALNARENPHQTFAHMIEKALPKSRVTQDGTKNVASSSLSSLRKTRIPFLS